MTSTRTTVRRPRRRENVPMAMHHVRVEASRRISPQTVRITFAGPSLHDFVDDGPDQRCKLFLPRPGGVVPPLGGPSWYEDWRRLADDVRPVMRTYTIRRSRPEQGQLDIDFLLREGSGPGTAWAASAQLGDRVSLFGPRADYAPPFGAESQLLIGDAAALPAISSILEFLPATARVSVLLEVDSPAEEVRLTTCADLSVTWLHLNGADPARSTQLLDALRDQQPGVARASAWIAGEAAMVRAVRRHLVCERGLSATDVQFMGYWRAGASIDPN